MEDGDEIDAMLHQTGGAVKASDYAWWKANLLVDVGGSRVLGFVVNGHICAGLVLLNELSLRALTVTKLS
jgi:hypothetical protein